MYYKRRNDLLNRLCRPWQRRYRRGSFAEQSHQPDKAFVTVCAMLHASTRIALHGTNRAKPFGRGFTGYAYVRLTLRAEIILYLSKKDNMNKLNCLLIIIQIFNIISAWFETGTQGSIDGYVLSLIVGFILLIGIVITYLRINIIENKKFRITNIILAISSMYLFYTQFPFIYYVTMNGNRINDVLTNIIVIGIAKGSAGVFERILPVIMYTYIGTNIYVCLGRIRIKTRKSTNN